MTDIIPDIVSQAAIDLLVTEEDSGEAYYTRHYTHFDWPAGASGPTIAIGYDCGYVTVAEARADWAGIVDDGAIAAITRACGLRGEAAHLFVSAHGASVTIGWDQAMREFTTREVPKWLARLQAAIPNTDKLSPDCLGALLSLAYNRGTGGFNDPSPRDSEMRAIKAHMQALDFSAIPHEFLSMRRLWPPQGDLWRRRGHEAALFQTGLSVTYSMAAKSP
jgi:GH24 family phage-related lysozyme (muramidase)